MDEDKECVSLDRLSGVPWSNFHSKDDICIRKSTEEYIKNHIYNPSAERMVEYGISKKNPKDRH